MKSYKIQTMARCAMIAALYTAVSLLLAPLSYGAVQVRIAEALTLLPVLTPLAVPGVAVGCLITNAYGVSAGANILGAADILLGTAATLLAALATRAMRRLTIGGLAVPASLPPVLFNAVVVGAELTWAEFNTLSTPMLWVYMLQVGLGQFISCTILGVLLVWMLQRAGLDRSLFGETGRG